MHQNLEIELKMLLSQEQFERLLEHYAPAQFVKQTNHYFQASKESKTQSVRVREINGSFLFTYKKKTPNGVLEHEKELPNLHFEQDSEILAFLSSKELYPPFHEIGTLTTERYLVNIQNQAELCFDINHYNGITDYEVEYEVTNDHDYQTSFESILAQANIQFVPNPISKVKRCFSTISDKKSI